MTANEKQELKTLVMDWRHRATGLRSFVIFDTGDVKPKFLALHKAELRAKADTYEYAAADLESKISKVK